MDFGGLGRYCDLDMYFKMYIYFLSLWYFNSFCVIVLLLANQIWACEYIKPIARLVSCLTNKKPYPWATGWGSLKKKVDYDDLKDMLRKLR